MHQVSIKVCRSIWRDIWDAEKHSQYVCQCWVKVRSKKSNTPLDSNVCSFNNWQSSISTSESFKLKFVKKENLKRSNNVKTNIVQMVIQVMGCNNSYRTRGYYNRPVAVTLKGVNNQFNITWESKHVLVIHELVMKASWSTLEALNEPKPSLPHFSRG